MRCEGLKGNPPTCRKSSRNIKAHYFSELRCLEVLLNTHDCFLNKGFYKCQSLHTYELCEANEGQGGLVFHAFIVCFLVYVASH